jgi:hypothetical protein
MLAKRVRTTLQNNQEDNPVSFVNEGRPHRHTLNIGENAVGESGALKQGDER